jgi:fido (protein-threonine AMPylation protein)
MPAGVAKSRTCDYISSCSASFGCSDNETLYDPLFLLSFIKFCPFLLSLRDQLRLLLALSGKTQTSLAIELDVSFVTFNRWFHGKAKPRKSAQRRIEKLLLTAAGLPHIPSGVLATKKEVLGRKARESANVLQTILGNPDIHDEFVLTLTYNTNQIEGSTLTQEETAVVLFQNGTVPRKTLAEQIEAKNHQAALEYLFSHLTADRSIDEGLILKLHGMVMNGLRDDAGMYRRHGVRIVGANIATANHLKVPELMKQLASDIVRPGADIVAHAAAVHARFEQIHPFADGNGRVGRLLIHASFLQKNWPPAVIRRENKRSYYFSLNTAQRYADMAGLEDFLCDAALDGWRILERKKPAR